MHAVVARSACRSQNAKTTHARATFGFFVASAKDSAPCPRWEKTWKFCGSCKSDGKRGALEVDLQRLISSGRHRQETCESGMFGGQGADFLRRVAFWSIRSSGSLRWFRDILWQVQHFVWPGPAFSPQAQYWWKNRKKRHWCILTRERQLSLKKLLRFWCWGISKTG